MIRSCNGYLKTPNYAHANNAIPVSVDDVDFTACVDNILAAVNDNTRMVYFANPENPAGTSGRSKRIGSVTPSQVSAR